MNNFLSEKNKIMILLNIIYKINIRIHSKKLSVEIKIKQLLPDTSAEFKKLEKY